MSPYFFLFKSAQQLLTYGHPPIPAQWTVYQTTLTSSGLPALNDEYFSTLREDTNSGTHYVYRIHTATIKPNIFYTNVMYVMYGGRDKVRLAVRQKDSTYQYANFNIRDGIIQSQSSGLKGASITQVATHTTLDRPIYRIAVTGNSLEGSYATTSLIYLLDADYNVSYIGNGNSGMYIWKAFSAENIDNEIIDYQTYSDATAVPEPSNGVVLRPTWDYERKDSKLKFKGTALSGLQPVYRTGCYHGWKIPIDYLESPSAVRINRWWKDKEVLTYVDGITHAAHEVLITNKNPPLNSLVHPYTYVYSGVVELQTKESIAA